MARNVTNFDTDFDHAEFGDVPFTPYVPPKKRISFESAVADFDVTGPNHFLHAIAFGLLGAALGSLIYAIFVGVTGWSIGYLAILVGYLVGKTMMFGSEDEGGDKYQYVAVALTYLSVAVAHAMVFWWFAEKDRPLPFDLHMAIGLAKYGILYPILHLIASPGYGVIGLVILFTGMRAAWRMTSDSPGAGRSPFRR